MPCARELRAKHEARSAWRWASALVLGLALSAGPGCASKSESPLEAYQASLALGSEHAFSVRTEGALQLDYARWASAFAPGGNAQGSAPRLQTHNYTVKATLHARVIELNDQGTLFAMRFSDYAGEVGGHEDLRADAFEAPFLVHMDVAGAFHRFDFPAGFPSDIADGIRGLVEPLQVVFARDAGSDAWDALERTSQGEATVRYRALGRSGDAVTLDRALVSAQRELPQVAGLRSGSLHHPLKVNGSSGKLVWSRSAGLMSLSFDDDVSAIVSGTTLSRHRLTYRAEQTAASQVDLPSTRADAEQLLAGTAFARARFYDVPAALRAELTAQTVDDADRRFTTEMLKSPATASHHLRHFVRLKPEAGDELAQRFSRLAPTAPNLRTLGHFYAALGAAGHREAQLTMADAIRTGSFGPASRDMAARGTLSVALPEPELVDAVWTYREELAQASEHEPAHLSLITNTFGALGGVEHAAPLISRTVVQKLASRLQGTSDKDEKLRMLTALANVGDLELTLPKVEGYLRHADPDFRMAAMRVFQKSGAPKAFAHFAALADGELDPDVRREAVTIAQNMPPTAELHGWARTRVLRDTDHVSRGRLVGLLGDGVSAHPENMTTLKTLLATETERDVRKAIYRYVSPAGGAL